MTSRIILILLFVSAVLPAQPPQDPLDEAIALQRKGEISGALEKLAPLLNSPGTEKENYPALLYSQFLLDLNDNSLPLEQIESAAAVKTEISDYLNFNLARIYLKRGLAENALEKIESIKEESLGSYFKYRYLREKARVCENLKLYGKEALVWGQIGILDNIGGQKKKEALFKEASAWQKSGADSRAKRMFRSIAFDFSPNPFGSRALKACIALGADDFPPAGAKEKEEVVKKLLACGRADDALFVVRSFPKDKENRLMLAQVLYKARKNEELFAIADEALQKPAADSCDKVIILRALWATLRTNDGGRADKYFGWLKSNLPEKTPMFVEANYAMGSFLFVNGKFKECLPHFNVVTGEKPGEFYLNAEFKNTMSRFALGEKPETLPAPLLENKTPFEERTVFSLKKWYGLEKEGYVPPADSYYAAISDKNFSRKAKEAINLFEKKLFAGKLGKESTAFKLYSAGFPLFALDQMEKNGSSLTKEDSITKMMLLSEIGELCFEVPSDYDYRLGLSHPTPWRGEIMIAAKEEGVDPSLMFAIARRESRFDPMAYSAVGAVGLFQLMPDTARKITGAEVSEEDLLDPIFNARIAARYLKELLKIFPSSAEIAASYNAGENCVSVWRQSFGDDETVFTLMIPYFETQGYTEGVLFDKAVYSERLGK
jgi:hypothetical protein